MDAMYITDSAKLLSGCLTALTAMVHLEVPHINVITKCDLVDPVSASSVLHTHRDGRAYFPVLFCAFEMHSHPLCTVHSSPRVPCGLTASSLLSTPTENGAPVSGAVHRGHPALAARSDGPKV